MPRPPEEEERVPTGICQPRIGQLSIIASQMSWGQWLGKGKRGGVFFCKSVVGPPMFGVRV